MPFVNIRLVREVIADDPEAKKEKIARGIVDTITKDDGPRPERYLGGVRGGGRQGLARRPPERRRPAQGRRQVSR